MKKTAKKWSWILSKLCQKRCLYLLFFLQLFSLSLFAQNAITGTVKNPEGNPVQGVSVVLKGTNNGVTSDANGHYSINVTEAKGTLIFSLIGMKSQNVLISGRTGIDINMEEDFSSLKGVVVVGYGTQSRELVTTSISKLDNKVLENVPYPNIASALEGAIPGLRVQNTSGQPGAAPRIILRGGTSINNPDGAAPLFVIDGVIRSDMNNLNAMDIKSIQVLKDAAATAIYGARGTNGVIIIVTKSGEAGKTLVNYNIDFTLSKTNKKYDLLAAKDFEYYSRLGILATSRNYPPYVNLLTGNSYPGGIGNDLTNQTIFSEQYLTPDNKHKLDEGWQSIPDPLDPTKTIIFSSTNFQDILYRTALSQNHSLSVSGGSEKATFRLGLGYQNDQGVAIHSGYNRYNVDFSGDLKLTKNFKVFTRVSFANTSDKQIDVGGIFTAAMIGPPTAKRYFEDGTLAPGESISYANPEYSLSTRFPNNNATNLTIIGGAQWKILPGLTFNPQISFYQRSVYSRNFTKSFLNGPINLNTSRTASGSYTQEFDPQGSAVLTYIKSIKNVHNIEVDGGFSYFGTDNTTLSATGNNAATDLIPTLNASGTPVSVSGTESHQIILGYFSRVTYNYKQKYLFNASLRYDGASVLGDQNKWGLFPGISLGWKVDKENFWKIFPENLIQLKLRGSYGATGNISGLGFYQAQGEYSTGTRYSGNPGIQITTLPNKDLKWEQSKTLDFGMDIGLFDNRVGITFDHYRRVTDNLLTTLSLPPSTGFSSILTNYGSLENKGYEIEISAQILPSSSAFQWNISFNSANVNTRILKLPSNGIPNNRVGGVNVWDAKTKSYQWKGGLQEGGRVGDLYGYKQLSIYPTDADAAAGPVDMLVPRTNKTKYGGDVNWLDADGNDTINTKDQVYMGNPYPHLTGGFTNTFSYKNISLYVRMDYTIGAHIYYETGARLEGQFSGANALSTDLLKSWKKQGDITDVPRYYFADQNGQWNVWNGRGSSRFFPSLDFLCIRELTLSYNLPQALLKRVKITDARLNVTGNNLHYFTKYPGLNPEATGTYYGYPNPMSLIFGLSITF